MKMSAKLIMGTVTIIATITLADIIVPADRVTNFSQIRSLAMVSTNIFFACSSFNVLVDFASFRNVERVKWQKL